MINKKIPTNINDLNDLIDFSNQTLSRLLMFDLKNERVKFITDILNFAMTMPNATYAFIFVKIVLLRDKDIQCETIVLIEWIKFCDYIRTIKPDIVSFAKEVDDYFEQLKK